MMSLPMEARAVHLQLVGARTAHRLWALNLHTEHNKPHALNMHTKHNKPHALNLHTEHNHKP